jgi:pimeloyl-ACP methyl ester carboxylesterase
VPDWLGLHGVPAGPSVFERLPVRTHRFLGVATKKDRLRWDLDSFVDEVRGLYSSETILLGHDLGGVVAAMAACVQAPKAVVLSGTALGDWWLLTRLSASPVVHHFFYRTFKGSLFVRMGGGKGVARRFSSELEHSHLPERMRRLAKEMRPPKDLIKQISTICPVFLVWGRREIFYPGFVAKRLSRQLHAPLYWIPGGHYCMWTHADAFAGVMRNIEIECGY